MILSVGRKVEKKGYDDLLKALARLPQALHWRFEHVGAGGLSDALKAQAAALGIAERCTWHGAQPQKAVFAALARADLFVLASKKAADGDQDGLPNVLMEAAHQGLPLVSTQAAAIGEFVEDGETGLLVAPGRARRARCRAGAHDRRSGPAAAAGRSVPARSCARASPTRPASTGSRGVAGPAPRKHRHGARRGVVMRVLLHTPLKAPDSPVPSGDREMARGLARLLERLGHEVTMPAASRVAPGVPPSPRICRWSGTRARRRRA